MRSVGLKHMTEEQRLQRASAFLSDVTAVIQPQAAAEKSDVNELSSTSLKVLIKAALELGIWLVGMYRTLGLHPAEGKQAVDDLLARGLVRIHRLVRKGRGGQPQVLELLPRGVAELEKRGISPAEKKVKRGGFKHDVYSRHIEKWARANGYRQVWFERTLGVKAFDLVLEREDGELIGVEVCLTGLAKWNASMAIKGASVTGISLVIVACEDRQLMKGIEHELAEQDGLGLFRKKIVLRHLSEYMTEE